MSRLLWAFVLLAAVAGVFVGAWTYLHWQAIAWQWASYQVGAATTFEQARQQFAWFEQGPHAAEKLRILVGKWGTGNPQFDRYLAEYASAGDSSMALRRAFSEELARRPELLPRWGHYWCLHASLEPDRHIESILEYLDALAFDQRAAAGPRLTWRELLDLQAVFVLSNDLDRAARVTPDNWREHYRVWTETQRTKLRHVPRPSGPLPD